MLPRLSLLLTVLAVGCAASVKAPRAPGLASLPSVELVTLDGQRERLDTAVAGRVALVSLWATWCEACQAEFAALGKLDDRVRAKGAIVLAVAVGEPRQTVAEFVARRGLRYAQLVDEEFKLTDAIGEKRVPTTLVIDRAGRVIFSGGALDDQALAALRSALK